MTGKIKISVLFGRIIFVLFFMSNCFGCNYRWNKNTLDISQATSLSITELDLEIIWVYRDPDRLGIEILVKNYPLPEQATLHCPFTRVDINTSGNSALLYKHPDQISLDEFYSVSRHNAWLCQLKQHKDGFADYQLSLTHFNEDRSLPDGSNNFQKDSLPYVSDSSTILIELGQVNALLGPQSVVSLPSLGSFLIDINFTETSEKLTWQKSQQIVSENIVIQVNRVALNPSVAWINSCIEMEDPHRWIPQANVTALGFSFTSTEYLITYPEYPFPTSLGNQRCFFFTIPFSYSNSSQLTDLQIGITQVTIDNTDSGRIRMDECKAVREEIEVLNDIQITCVEFEIHGETHHWFQIDSFPESMTNQDAYELVKKAFTKTLIGPWSFTVDFQ